MLRMGVVCRLNAANVGDSAMYDCLVTQYGNQYELFPITDSEGAAEACRKNGYPNATTESDVRLDSIDTLHIGGGDFYPGIIAERLAAARSDVPVIASGLSFHTCPSGSFRALLDRAQWVHVRDYESRRYYPRADTDSDLAWKLPWNPNSYPQMGHALVTLRAPASLPPEDTWLGPVLPVVLDELEHSGVPWMILPFNMDDAIWTERAGVPKVCILPAKWLSPGDAQAAKSRVSSAAYVITLGRLHPVVFAGSLGIPCLAITCRHPQVGPKIQGFMAWLGQSQSCVEAECGEDVIRAAVRRLVCP